MDYILAISARLKTGSTRHCAPKNESDHRLVSASIHLLERSVPNSRPKARSGDSEVSVDRKLLASDVQRRMIESQAIAAELLNATNSIAVLDVSDMAYAFTSALRQPAVDMLPRCPKNPPI